MRLIRVDFPNGSITNEYTDMELTSTTDRNGNFTYNLYDSMTRLVAATDMRGYSTEHDYCGCGTLSSITNALSNTAFFNYDYAKNRVSTVLPDNSVMQAQYNLLGQTTVLVDPAGNTMTNAAGASIIQYSYDPENRMTNRWTAAKGNTTFRYDENGNLTNVVYAVSPSLTFRYDGVGALTNMVDAVGTNSWSTTYTTNGTFRADDGPWANDILWYAHNTNGLFSSVTISNGAVYQVSYTYDVANRVSNIVSSAGTFGYTYSGASSLLKKIGLGNSSYVTNTFDSMGRLLSTQLRNSGNQILNAHTYAYNLGSQRTSQRRVDGSVLSYSYDPIGQLKSATGVELDGTPRLHEKFGYAYDAAGNLQYKTNNALVQTFNTDSLNQLTTVTRANSFTVAGTTSSQAESVTVNGAPAALYTDFTFAKEGVTLTNGANTFTAIGTSWQGTKSTNTVSVTMPTTATFTYDANGNMTSDGYLGHDYDDENQLIRVTSTNSWKSEFTYDGMRRRRIRKEYAWSGGAWSLSEEVRYVYDGMLPVEERDGSNNLKVRYTRGLDLSGSMQGAGGIGGLLARTVYSEGTPSHAYYHADGNGNITFLADTNQTAVATYLYDPYGKVLAAAGPMAETNRMQFSSKESDLRTRMSYYGYRYYAANLQRWMNRDPLGVGGDILLFTFMENYPNSIQAKGGLKGNPNKIVLGPFRLPSCRSALRNWLRLNPLSDWRGDIGYDFVNSKPLFAFDPLGLFSIKFHPDSSLEFISHWVDVLLELIRTPSGKKLINLQPDKTVTIWPRPHPGGATDGEDADTGVVGLYPHNPIGINPETEDTLIWDDDLPPDSKAGAAVVLAHELGHALFDFEPREEDTTVQLIENPVREDLDLPIRLKYGGVPLPSPAIIMNPSPVLTPDKTRRK